MLLSKDIRPINPSILILIRFETDTNSISII